MPIPMIGEGKLTVGDDGLEASALKKPTNYLLAFVPVMVVLGIVGYGFSAAMLGLGRTIARVVAIAIVLAIVAIFTRRKSGAPKNAQPWTVKFPWSSVKKVTEDPQAPGALLIHIKGMTPKGTLHFRPSQLPMPLIELITELQRRSAR